MRTDTSRPLPGAAFSCRDLQCESLSGRQPLRPIKLTRLSLMTQRIEVPTGTVFGDWTVLSEVEPRQFPSGQSHRMMRCQCKCGRIKNVQLTKLRNDKSKQCNSCKNRRHGARKTPEWRCWVSMHNRCYYKNHKNFADYGGRGVHVCERWHRDSPDGFVNFLKDMGKKPSAAHSLDKDLKKPGNLCYCPEYCCWATRQEQNRNRRNNRMLTHQCKTQCVAAWAEELGMTSEFIRDRLNRGWSDEDALTKPVDLRFSSYRKAA